MTEIEIGRHVLQPNRQLLLDGEHIHLGPRALKILTVLAEADGEIVTKDELMEAVWGGVTVEENALQVHVTALRKALEDDAERLHTIRGIGYQLEKHGSSIEYLEARHQPEDDEPANVGHPDQQTSERRILRLAWVLIVAALISLTSGAYFVLGDDFDLISSNAEERIPVVVRPLVAGPSASSSEAALAQGISDELIVRLRSIPELQIATVQADGRVPSGTFANAYLVEGTIRSTEDQLRVVVRLSDPDGEILWSESFDRTLVDLLELQRTMASEIASALNVPFDVGTYAAKNGGTDNPEAYAAYIRAMQHNLDLDSEAPMSHLQRAVSLDPDFVLARLGIASISTVILSTAPNLTDAQVQDLLATIDEETANALNANPDMALGHAGRGWYWLQLNDVPAAARELELARSLDPGDDLLLRSTLATFAQFMGRNQEALAIRKGSSMIDPIAINQPYLVYDLFAVGEYRQATAMFEKLERASTPGTEFVVFHAFMSYLLGGEDEDEAVAFLRDRVPPFAEIYVTAMEKDEFADMSLGEIQAWADRNYGAGGYMHLAARASIEAYAGRNLNAIRLLRIAMERPGGNANFYLWYPTLSEVRRMPEFHSLIEDMQLEEVWRASGDWGDYCRPISETEFTCS